GDRDVTGDQTCPLPISAFCRHSLDSMQHRTTNHRSLYPRIYYLFHNRAWPADSVQIQVTNEETGQIYNNCSEEQNVCAGGNNGRYTIMHDGFHGKISTEGEDILVSGEKGQLQFQAKYTFRSGECHLQKLAGPDTVSLSKK